MEVILKETIDTLGQEGDVVKVKNGYGRNYLLPQKKAVLADKSGLNQLKVNQDAIKARLEKERLETLSLAERIAGVTVEISRRAGTENRLFGSVTNGDIAEKLAEMNVKINRKNIILSEPIKALGGYRVQVKIGYQAVADLTVQVVAEQKDTVGEE